MKIDEPTIKTSPEEPEKEVSLPSRPDDGRRFPFHWIYIPVISILLTVVIAGVSLILVCSQSVTVETGDVPDYSHITSNGFVSLFCDIETDLSAVDTLRPHRTKVSVTLLGFIRCRSVLHIRDTVLPRIKPQKVCVTLGTDITGDMFAREVEDKTKVSFAILSAINGKEACHGKTVALSATDEGGNVVNFTGELAIVDPRDALVFEYGVTKEHIRSAVASVLPHVENFDLSSIEGCGRFVVTGKDDDTAYFATASIFDTVPPVGDVNSFDVPLGEKRTDGEIVTNISDRSDVTVAFLNRADFDIPGEHTVTVRLTDGQGNTTEYTSSLRIHDIHTEITAEMLSSNEALAELIFNDAWSKNHLSFGHDNVLSGLEPGRQEILLIGAYNTISVDVNLVDTVAPVFSLGTKRYLVGIEPSPSDFVISDFDATPITYSFKTAPDSSKEGTFEIIIVATDTSGNTAEEITSVTFFYDTTPPTLSGHKNLTLELWQSYDFGSGVTARDSEWGTVGVEVDSSAVDVNTPGTYPLVYTATDGAGNMTKETVTVTVKAPASFRLDVKNIMQKPALPNGCEVVSLAIALQYAGYPVDPVTLYDKFMPKSPLRKGDPWTTYVGNAKGTGFGCYAPCVVTTGNAYLASVDSSKTVSDVSGQSLADYEKLLLNGTPVILWGTLRMNGNATLCWEATIDGKYVNWHSYSHCLVLIGYTKKTYVFCDPLRGVVEYTKSAVQTSFSLNYKQACIVE